MSSIKIKIKKKPGFEDFELPAYMSAGAAGMDLAAAIEKETVIDPGKIRYIPAGIYISLPEGYEAQIRPRSGLARKYGVSIVNSPGTVDSDYRGEVGVILVNLGTEPVTVTRGMRIAQMVIQEVVRADWDMVDSLDRTERNEGGFGGTGL